MFVSRHRVLSMTLLCAVLMLAVTSTATAGVLELLSHGTSGWINNAFFKQVDPDGSTGTGLIQPFLHVQKTGIEQGFNTDYSPKQFPETNSPWTKSLLLSAVPVKTIGGVNYREFLLDINESGGGQQYLSLDKLQLFLGDRGDLTGYPTGLGTMVWDMDAGPAGDMWIALDYALEAGSGDGDMLAYIPDSLFTGGSYVYLYCMFGAEGTKDNGLGASDGFEEWAVRVPGPVIPEPASLIVLSTGLISMLGLGMRKFKS